MMKNAKKWLLASAAFLCVGAGAFAQDEIPDDPRYGATPEEREQTLVILTQLRYAYDLKNYDAALQHVRTLLEKAPQSHVNIYIRGANIYKTKINQATSRTERNLYVDSLMNIYDMRAEYFGDSPTQGRVYILTQKANDFLNLNPFERERIQQYFKDAIEATEGQDPLLITNYFKVLVDDYASDLVETDVLMIEFERLNELLTQSTEPPMVEAVKNLEALLVSSNAASCEKLEQVYKPQYEADPNNVELMRKIVNMMGRAKCNSDFMLLLTENLYKVEPDAQTGVYLASIYEQKEDYEKSLFYWQESINTESNPSIKKEYILGAASSALAVKNYRQAVTFARELLGIDPENGMAYMIIGQSYGASASTSCGSGFDQQAVFWLAVDNLQRARSLLSGDASQAEALSTLNSTINSFSTNFPSGEDVFFRTLNNGDPYTVNCGWISGRTTIR